MPLSPLTVDIYPIKDVLSAIGLPDLEIESFMVYLAANSNVSWGWPEQRTAVTWKYLKVLIPRWNHDRRHKLISAWRSVLRPSNLVGIDYHV